ncbi:MAG: MinD superfamily P-loop ATPase containing an inserted ferredoxin domain [Candidatus Methanohalarchaeum thermophilum]|uniref:MinD superfamily P-loop ATPase containing an inserted ferredoxin domain n=1 Tax=Methanohalarchaeum thermophilum TaxID=1903181 RepID=A0A1Q6DSK6_METT1|nr:MAG: MinD superfamily P-loop ATPase containing an inserted ferredoxin domain [Candidatus Methanohalarchaeum thermophilum]
MKVYSDEKRKIFIHVEFNSLRAFQFYYEINIEVIIMNVGVASGKGGTGKTTVAVNLALSLNLDLDLGLRFLDCDVEEPNSNLFFGYELDRLKTVEKKIPNINYDKCNFCKKCMEYCEFNALAVVPDEVMVFDDLCHSCGLCSMVCPEEAIKEKGTRIGEIKTNQIQKKPKKTNEIDKSNEKTKNSDKSIPASDNEIEFYEGEMDVGRVMSSPVISELKKQIDNSKLNILDIPPGSGCPVIEAMDNLDYLILVTEPTKFGLSDLKNSVKLAEAMKIPHGVIINKSQEDAQETHKYCSKKDIPIHLEIPNQREIAELYSDGVPFITQMPQWKKKFRDTYSEIKEKIEIEVN